MAWYTENPVRIKDVDALVAIERYNKQRSSSPENPRAHVFGIALMGPWIGTRITAEQRKAGKYPVGIKFHCALTEDDAEILIGCGVTGEMMDVPGTYFYGAIVDPSK